MSHKYLSGKFTALPDINKAKEFGDLNKILSDNEKSNIYSSTNEK